MTKDEFIDVVADHVDEHFPKGISSERGEAMVLVAMITKELLDRGLLKDG